MKLLIVIASLLALSVAATIPEADKATYKIWTVLVAGSNGYYNYRHQADVCHAYHVLHNHGIPDENIIVMMYDDIAESSQNPTKGIIINHPNGSDVYAGTPKDYVKDTVTAANFLKILKGETPKGGSGKKFSPTKNDHVFLNFVDHGAPGIVAFPVGSPLTKKDLMDTLTELSSKNSYNKLVFYVEACESGSMFYNLLPTNISIYATTAANPDESSYACYYDSKRNTYLGDVYSVKWMEDSDKEDLTTWTLKEQFDIVKKETTTSHVMEYGELTLSKLVVGQFQGDTSAKKTTLPTAPLNAVPSWDVPVQTLLNQLSGMALQDSRRGIVAAELQSMLANREVVRQAMLLFAEKISSSSVQANMIANLKGVPIVDLDCHDQAVKFFHDNCLTLNDNSYALRFMHMLVNACESKIPISAIRTTLQSVFSTVPKNNLYI